MKRCLLTSTGALVGAAITVGVFIYNYWMYCCGRCTVGTLLTIGPFGLLLLGFTLAGGILLAALKYFRNRSYAMNTCACGIHPSRSWRYCPFCGAKCHPPATSSET